MTAVRFEIERPMYTDSYDFISDFDTILNCIFNWVSRVLVTPHSQRNTPTTSNKFNQQRGIARGSGMVEKKKMCQQSNVLLPDTDWHRLLQHNKISTDADAYNGRRRASNHRMSDSRREESREERREKKRESVHREWELWVGSRGATRAKSITCRIIIIIFIIVHVSFFPIAAVAVSCLPIYDCLHCLHCLHCLQSPCKSISGMQLQNRWYFNQFDRLHHIFYA